MSANINKVFTLIVLVIIVALISPVNARAHADPVLVTRTSTPTPAPSTPKPTISPMVTFVTTETMYIVDFGHKTVQRLPTGIGLYGNTISYLTSFFDTRLFDFELLPDGTIKCTPKADGIQDTDKCFVTVELKDGFISGILSDTMVFDLTYDSEFRIIRMADKAVIKSIALDRENEKSYLSLPGHDIVLLDKADGKTVFYNYRTDKELASVDLDYDDFDITPGSDFLILYGDKVQLWDIRSDKPKLAETFKDAKALYTISTDGTMLAMRSKDEIVISDLETRKEISKIKLCAQKPLESKQGSMYFSPDDKYLAVGAHCSKSMDRLFVYQISDGSLSFAQEPKLGYEMLWLQLAFPSPAAKLIFQP